MLSSNMKGIFLMEDYDVIIIGAGANGLTAGAYLSKAGLKTLVVEARGECGAHMDSTEPGIPGFLHNLHATLILTAMSPAMGDLELDKYGLEFRTTDVAYCKTFEDGKNVILSNDPFETMESWRRHSEKDGEFMLRAGEILMGGMEHIKDTVHHLLNTAPTQESLKIIADFCDELMPSLGVDITFNKLWSMNGFQSGDMLFASEHVKTMLQSVTWIGGYPPIHPAIGSLGVGLMAPISGPILPSHQVKGGSHGVTHALLKAATANGATILPCCPVKEIIVKNGEAKGVVLSDEAIFSNEKIYAKKVISDLTVVPTFRWLIPEEEIGAEMARRIDKFDYNEQVLFGVHYALDGDPTFASADYDKAVQRSWVGYFGGKDTKAMYEFNKNLVNGIITEEIIANWFIPTRADPTQAPDGCHTAMVWTDVPPEPKEWKYGPLNKGIAVWDDIKERMADDVTDAFERYAPGFKKLIKERVLYTCYDVQRNNPAAINGNWFGGSNIPSQFWDKRPVPGVLKGGGSRTFVKNLYISNSTHPGSLSGLASGYIAADEVAQDLGARDQGWWKDKALDWYFDNIENVKINLGVKE